MSSVSVPRIFSSIDKRVATHKESASGWNINGVEMRSISGMRRGMLQLVQREDGISFIECALVGALAAVVAGMAFLALSKRT